MMISITANRSCTTTSAIFPNIIAPGAKRIGWSKYGANLDVTAAVNPDGSYVVILLNRTKEDSGCFLRVNGHIMRVDLPAETLSTVVIEK